MYVKNLQSYLCDNMFYEFTMCHESSGWFIYNLFRFPFHILSNSVKPGPIQYPEVSLSRHCKQGSLEDLPALDPSLSRSEGNVVGRLRRCQSLTVDMPLIMAFATPREKILYHYHTTILTLEDEKDWKSSSVHCPSHSRPFLRRERHEALSPPQHHEEGLPNAESVP